VVGVTPDDPAGVQSIQRVDADVVVVDLIVQALHGVSLIRDIKACAQRSAIVALSMCVEEAYVAQALQNGALGFVLKKQGFDELARAVRHAAAGRQYLSPGLDADAIRRYVASSDRADRFENLTAREREVLQLAALGSTSAQIATQLGISRRTAETHRANICKKLDFEAHVDLVSFAVRRGLVTRDA
jgi:DNA-binding NarL/FixJ family response regulator